MLFTKCHEASTHKKKKTIYVITAKSTKKLSFLLTQLVIAFISISLFYFVNYMSLSHIARLIIEQYVAIDLNYGKFTSMRVCKYHSGYHIMLMHIQHMIYMYRYYVCMYDIHKFTTFDISGLSRPKCNDQNTFERDSELGVK